jgi:hypothetical protein
MFDHGRSDDERQNCPVSSGFCLPISTAYRPGTGTAGYGSSPEAVLMPERFGQRGAPNVPSASRDSCTAGRFLMGVHGQSAHPDAR